MNEYAEKLKDLFSTEDRRLLKELHDRWNINWLSVHDGIVQAFEHQPLKNQNGSFRPHGESQTALSLNPRFIMGMSLSRDLYPDTIRRNGDAFRKIKEAYDDNLFTPDEIKALIEMPMEHWFSITYREVRETTQRIGISEEEYKILQKEKKLPRSVEAMLHTYLKRELPSVSWTVTDPNNTERILVKYED